MSLTEQLKALNEKGLAGLPEDVRAIMSQAMDEMIASGVVEQALGVGDRVSDFDLPNAKGESVRFSELLTDGPVVVSFYRGGWCPYCNLELRALQEKLPEIENLGASLLAISPERPDNSLSTAEKNAVSFDVLSDVGNEVARQFGLVFELPMVLRPLYEKFGIDLLASNGDESFTLPVPATYIVGQDGAVLGCHVDMDYSTRMDPEAVLTALRAKAA